MQLFTASLNLYPDKQTTEEEKVEAARKAKFEELKRQADIAMASGDYQQAAKLYGDALAVNPKSKKVKKLQGEALAKAQAQTLKEREHEVMLVLLHRQSPLLMRL